MTNKMATICCLLDIALLITVFQLCGAQRKITKEILQGTNITEAQYSVAHITAAGPSDELHYLISTLGYPTLYVAYTKPNTEVVVNWEDFMNETLRGQSIQFTAGNVLYSYSLFFTKLIDYNDTKDYSDLTKYTADSTNWNTYNLDELSWESFSEQDPNGDTNTVEFRATNDTVSELWQYDGSFTIMLTPFPSSGRGSQLPHLQYSENITQLDLTIDHVWTNFSMSRFAVELVMVAGDATPLKIDETRSIDDEYTPGVFYINNLLTKPDQDTGGFLQWKPVCYTDLKRGRNVATSVKHYQIQAVNNDVMSILKSSLLYAVNGDGMDHMAQAAANISFGLSQDGGYNKTQILAWTATLGYGVPPKDAVSTIVIIIISSGLGIPVVIILFGGLFVCYKKRSSKTEKSVSNGYQRIGAN